MSRTVKTIALLGVTAGLILAGCGDDEDEPQALTGATGATGESAVAVETKADWIAAADDICRQADEEFAELAQDQYPEGPPVGEDAVRFGEDVVIPNLESQHQRIEALPVPEGEEEAVGEILDDLQAGIDALKGEPGSFLDSHALDDVQASAQAYGLKVCASE